jgi:hypothetical protein
MKVRVSRQPRGETIAPASSAATARVRGPGPSRGCSSPRPARGAGRVRDGVRLKLPTLRSSAARHTSSSKVDRVAESALTDSRPWMTVAPSRPPGSFCSRAIGERGTQSTSSPRAVRVTFSCPHNSHRVDGSRSFRFTRRRRRGGFTGSPTRARCSTTTSRRVRSASCSSCGRRRATTATEPERSGVSHSSSMLSFRRGRGRSMRVHRGCVGGDRATRIGRRSTTARRRSPSHTRGTPSSAPCRGMLARTRRQLRYPTP